MVQQLKKSFGLNRLLINMKNKIDTINGAIEMINNLQKGKTIKLNGLYSYSVSAEGNPNFDFEKRLTELFEERERLQIRVDKMGG